MGRSMGRTGRTITMTNTSVENDSSSKKIEGVTCFDIVKLLVFRLFAYTADVITDVWAAYEFYTLYSTGFFSGAVTFIVVPAFITNLISWQCYKDDNDTSIYKGVAHLILLGPLLRSANLIKYAVKLRTGKIGLTESEMNKYNTWYSNAALIGVLEALIEAEPQLILQLSRILPGHATNTMNLGVRSCISVSFSILSVGLAIVTYHTYVRKPQAQKKNIGYYGMSCQFMWHLMITVSRVISLGCLVSVYPLWALGACILHFLFFLIYLCIYGPERRFESPLSKYGLLFVIAFAYLFNGIHVRDGPTFKFYITLYIVFFVENVIALSAWCWVMSCSYTAIAISAVSVFCFFFGIIFNYLYYTFLHPNKVSCKTEKTVYVASNGSVHEPLNADSQTANTDPQQPSDVEMQPFKIKLEVE